MGRRRSQLRKQTVLGAKGHGPCGQGSGSGPDVQTGIHPARRTEPQGPPASQADPAPTLSRPHRLPVGGPTPDAEASAELAFGEATGSHLVSVTRKGVPDSWGHLSFRLSSSSMSIGHRRELGLQGTGAGGGTEAEGAEEAE